MSYDASTPYYVQLVGKGALRAAPLLALQPERADTAGFGVPLQYSVGKTDGHRLTLDWKLAAALDLKSISSYRKLTQGQYDNGEANLSVFVPNGNFARYSLADFWQHQYSEELQLVGDLPQVRFVTGAFYYHEYVHDDAWSPNTERFNAGRYGIHGPADTARPDAFPRPGQCCRHHQRGRFRPGDLDTTRCRRFAASHTGWALHP